MEKLKKYTWTYAHWNGGGYDCTEYWEGVPEIIETTCKEAAFLGISIERLRACCARAERTYIAIELWDRKKYADGTLIDDDALDEEDKRKFELILDDRLDKID